MILMDGEHPSEYWTIGVGLWCRSISVMAQTHTPQRRPLCVGTPPRSLGHPAVHQTGALAARLSSKFDSINLPVNPPMDAPITILARMV